MAINDDADTGAALKAAALLSAAESSGASGPDEESNARPTVISMAKRHAPNLMETELRLLRQAFVEQGKYIGTLAHGIERTEAQLTEHAVQVASLRHRFDALEERVHVMEHRLQKMDAKLDSIGEALKALLSR
jgi:uncharacterized small protein (DUF1192 family)